MQFKETTAPEIREFTLHVDLEELKIIRDWAAHSSRFFGLYDQIDKYYKSVIGEE